jgi:hypothetical protein
MSPNFRRVPAKACPTGRELLDMDGYRSIRPDYLSMRYVAWMVFYILTGRQCNAKDKSYKDKSFQHLPSSRQTKRFARSLHRQGILISKQTFKANRQ